MNKKKLRYSFVRVIEAAESLECKDLHHKTAHQHDNDEMCPAKYELSRHCNILREYMEEQGL